MSGATRFLNKGRQRLKLGSVQPKPLRNYDVRLDRDDVLIARDPIPPPE